jgi:integrase
MSNMILQSPLSNEISLFYDFMKLSVVDHRSYKTTLSSLDAFLYSENVTEKGFESDLIMRWLDTFTHTKLQTKKSKLGHIRKFTEYLTTLGIETSLPELPKVVHNFEPYVFSFEEMTQIFEVADDLAAIRPNSIISAEFPVLLRILYGCGMRLGEAASLAWNDVDLNKGIITVKVAKNQKQRIVPMSAELTRILKLYQATPAFAATESGYVFKKSNGKPRTSGAYWSIFDSILCELGIKNAQTAKTGDRGPCIHSLRHTFVMHAFMKLEQENCCFQEAVPFLSTYIGHERLTETDKYLKARHELYTDSHTAVSDYIADVFPEVL